MGGSLALTEFKPVLLPESDLPWEVGITLNRDFASYVDVQFPTPRTGGRWQLQSLGWVGHLPVADDFALCLDPKVPLANLFGMLEYAHGFRRFRFLEGQAPCSSLSEYYDRLARALADRVLLRGRKGFYRTYLSQVADLACVRGRLDVRHLLRHPMSPTIRCEDRVFTGDVEDNQIPAWALNLALRSGLCRPTNAPTVRKALRELEGLVTMRPLAGAACVGRTYHRLNDDYEPIHILSRFFLEHAGPALQQGDRKVIPFLVNMYALFENFVAEWLRAHLPAGIVLEAQKDVPLGGAGDLRFRMDLVLSDARTGAARCVLDTKYKAGAADESDIAQVIAYAVAVGCKEAVLVYPQEPPRRIDTTKGGIRVRTMAFRLGDDIEPAGRAFLSGVLGAFEPPPVRPYAGGPPGAMDSVRSGEGIA